MPKKRKRASIPIDNEDKLKISDLQKKHYSKLGYKPYLSHSGKVKWLSFEQHTYEKIKYSLRDRISHPSPKIVQTRKHKSRVLKKVSRAMINNWLLIFIITITLFILIFINNIMAFFGTY